MAEAMPLVEILDVQTVAGGGRAVAACVLDAPLPGRRMETYGFAIEGWVLGRHAPAVAVQVVGDDGPLRWGTVRQPRPDVRTDYPDAPAAERSGFRLWVSVLGLRPEFELKVRAVFADERTARIATIRGRRQPLRTGFEPALQPIMLTTVGRTGSTWSMRLLAEHPRVVAHRIYPYETRVARYWLHMLKVLTDPMDHERSGHPDYFQNDKLAVPHNPFYPEPLGRSPRLDQWLGRDYVEGLTAFCQRAVEECYLRIAEDQGQTGARYFAEKHRPDTLPSLYWELYPGTKEIFLVRDFRDLVTSMLAFNEARGSVQFGRQLVESDEAFVRDVARGRLRHLESAWQTRRGRSHLLRYEDLVQRPVETLRDLLRYLDLEHDETTIAGMIERSAETTPELQVHQTSGQASRSIGRWRTDLDPILQAAAQEELRDALDAFGYDT
jgi:hypothetical protein